MSVSSSLLQVESWLDESQNRNVFADAFARLLVKQHPTKSEAAEICSFFSERFFSITENGIDEAVEQGGNANTSAKCRHSIEAVRNCNVPIIVNGHAVV
jgi:hypothetical protein